LFEYGNPLPFDAALNPFAGFTYSQQVATLEGIYNGILASFGAPPISVGSDTPGADRIRRSNADEFQDLDLDTVLLTYNHDFDGFTLTSVTGHIEYEEDRLTGSSSGIDISNILTREEYKQFSQEIRFTSDLDGPLNWIAGGFFQDWDLEADESTLVDEMNMPVLLGVLGVAPGLEAVANLDSTRFYTGDSKTYAAFGQFTWSLSDRARLTLGGRYSREEKGGRRFVDIFNTTTGEFDIAQAIFASCGFGVDYQSLGELSALIPLPGCDGIPAVGAYSTHDASGERTESAFTPSVIGELDIGNDHMAFLSYSKGFKAGGFDARAPRENDFEYEDEQVDTFELGLKSTLADGAAQTNLTFYYSKYTDRQVTIFDGVAGFVVGNAAESEAQGFEFDGRWRATDNLTLAASLGYLDYEIIKHDDAPCSPLHTLQTGEVLCDRAGRGPTYVPDWSASLIADHILPINNKFDFRTTLDINYEGDYFSDTTQDENLKQDAYTMFNLRLALEAESWTLALLGKNLTDKEVIEFSSVVPLSGSSLRAPAYSGFLQPPRTVAIQFEYRF
jgi:outer membrane receptor protein involved in Fe transport